MQFSYDWLKTWISPELSAEELAHLLTMSGLEVEETVTAAPFFTGILVGEVLRVEKHPDADKLNMTLVNIGQEEPLQIVCGAPNVAVGIKVPCATVGAVLPGDFKIKPAKMRGQVSNGMLCSEKELGLSKESHGLFILPADAPIGADIRDYLALDDAVFELKITPNRADCLSIKGLAREVHALTDCINTPLSIAPIPAQTDKKIATHIDAPQDCGAFLSRVIENIDPKIPTPMWMKHRLERSGIRSLNLLVDIGNYVMLELGQPMHLFDLDKLSGDITIRRANDKESLPCLNEKNVTLKDDTLVIADAKGPLSIAGLMGGEASAITLETHHVLLESAFFYPEAIAGRSRQYGFSSDSSFRFERGVDYKLQEDAIERATALIVGICGGEPGPINHAQSSLPTEHSIKLRLKRAEAVLGIALDPKTVYTIFKNLGFQPQETEDGFNITTPSFRFDINEEIDLIEEIGRVLGYENIPDDRIMGRLDMLNLPEDQRSRFSVYQTLAARSYQEVVNYAFVDDAWEKDFADNDAPIHLQNPIASHLNVMRSTLIGSLVETLTKNLNRKHSRVRLFEIARVFSKNETGDFLQPERVGGLAYGHALPEQWGTDNRRVDFYDVKQDIVSLFHPNALTFKAAKHPALHPGRTAFFYDNDELIGFLGELHPKWVQKYDLSQAPILFEMDLDALRRIQKVTYQTVSKFPAVRRDLAFVLPEDMSADVLLDALRAVKNTPIEHMAIFDVYKGEGLETKTKSLAVRFMFRNHERTMQDEEIEKWMQDYILAAQKINISLRT